MCARSAQARGNVAGHANVIRLAALTAWLSGFLFTQVVEVPINTFALRRDGPPRVWWRRAALAFGASAITHPFVWFLFPALPQGWACAAVGVCADALGDPFGWHLIPRVWQRYYVMVLEAETFAVVVEGFYLRALGLRRAFLWSLAANLASVTLGFVARYLFGWP